MVDYTYGTITWNPLPNNIVAGSGIVSYQGKAYDITIYGVGTPDISIVSYLQFRGAPEDMTGWSIGITAALGIGLGIAFGFTDEGLSGYNVGSVEFGFGFSLNVTNTVIVPIDDPNEPSSGWPSKVPSPPRDPLVLDLDGNGIDLVDVDNSNAHFDFGNDGFAEKTGWISQNDALLVRDVNGNGTVDGIGELFGNPDVDAFTHLAQYDSNDDGKIDASDAVFSTLRLWKDLDGDAVFDQGEMFTLASEEISSISLTRNDTNTDINGNIIDFTGSFTRTDGSISTAGAVLFETNPTISHWAPPDGFQVSGNAAVLPDLKGYGLLPELSAAMTLDGALLSLVQGFVLEITDLSAAEITSKFQEILFEWADVSDVSETSRGSWVDGRQVAFLEQYFGVDIQEGSTSAIGQMYGRDLTALFSSAEDLLLARFLSQASFSAVIMGADLDAIQASPLYNSFGLMYDVGSDTFRGDVSAVVDQIVLGMPSDAVDQIEYLSIVSTGLRGLRYEYFQNDSSLLLDFIEERVIASDAQNKNAIDLIKVLLAGGDVVKGTDGADTLHGSTLASDLYGSVYIGGHGDDSIVGGAQKNDVYVYKRGDGNDTIFDGNGSGSESDVLILSGVTPDEVSLGTARSSTDVTGLDLILMIRESAPGAGDGGTILLWDFLTYDGASHGVGSIEYVQFEDGTVWNRHELQQKLISDQASDEDDTIIGNPIDDEIVGGKGDDHLAGSSGNDRYLYARGDGNDIIDDPSVGYDGDELVFTDISSSDVEFFRQGSDLVILIAATPLGEDGGQVTLRDWAGWRSAGIDRVTFSDGVSWDRGGLASAPIVPIRGSVENDTVTGSSSNDIIIGGPGDDLLQGGAGSDQYVYSSGDGSDVINDGANETAAYDILIFEDLSETEISLSREASDLIISILPTGNTIRVENQWSGSPDFGGIERIQFASGATLSRAAIMELQILPISGTLGDAILIGTGGSDELEGGPGNDTLDGGSGNDLHFGGAGDDLLIGNAGDDSFDGGEGNDTLDFTYYALDYDVNLTTGQVMFDDGASETATNIENVVAGAGANQIYGTNGNNVLDGGAGNDTLYGNGGDDILIGGDGDDILKGGGGNDRLSGGLGLDSYDGGEGFDIVDFTYSPYVWEIDLESGQAISDQTIEELRSIEGILAGAGNDILTGNAEDNHIEGGEGNDRLKGGLGDDVIIGDQGDDTYVYAVGDGNDTIVDAGTSVTETDILSLSGVYENDITAVRNGVDLIITIASTQQTITVKDQYSSSSSGVGLERIDFADGAFWDRTAILAIPEEPAGPTYPTSTIVGTSGNDVLAGTSGDDVFEGGAGNDQFNSGAGSDAYLYASGDGDDYLDEESGSTTDVDVLYLTDLNADDITVGRNGVHVTLTVNATGHVITLDEQLYSTTENWGIERIEFADGTTWNRQQIAEASAWIHGTTGNDNLVGGAGDDIFVGGLGDDYLNGSEGSDTYIYASGDGDDYIDDESGSLEAIDVLRLTDLNVADVSFGAVDGSHVTVTVNATGQVITLDEQLLFQYGNLGVEQIEFADGTIWDRSQISTAAGEGGAPGTNVIEGTAGDDTLIGTADNDTFHGGLGDDYMDGGEGGDTFVYASGDGSDYIDDESGSLTSIDVLELTDLNLDDLSFDRSGANVTLTVNGTGDVITLDEQLAYQYGNLGIETIEFADGTTFNRDQIRYAVGSDDDDTMVGTAGNDIFSGGPGNDLIITNGGDDLILFKPGFGQDIVTDFTAGAGTDDVLQFNTSLFADFEAVLSAAAQSGNDTVISFDATNTITLQNVLKTDLHHDDVRFVA